jgi:DNA-binding transcriptional LysR family regulator
VASIDELSIADFSIALDLARLQSIRELARRRGVQPSQVSRAVTRIEKAFQTRLFERSVTGMVVTARGRVLMEHFARIHVQLDEARIDRGAPNAPIGIGSTAFLNTRLVAPAICSLNQSVAPELFRLVDFAPDDLVRYGISGAFVAAVHIGALDWPRSWQSKRVGQLPWCLYARPGHPLTKRRRCVEATVKEFPFVYPLYWTPSGFAYGNDNCPLKRQDRLTGTSSATAEAALAIVANSDQLAYLPKILAKDDVSRGHLAQIKVSGWMAVSKPVYLSVREDAVSKKHFDELSRATERRLLDR